MSYYIKYWEECLSSSFEEHGVMVTPEQLTAIAEDVKNGNENYGQAFYQPENPMIEENKKLAKALAVEKGKIGCLECRGSGRIIENFANRSSNSQCYKCHGEGKHLP